MIVSNNECNKPFRLHGEPLSISMYNLLLRITEDVKESPREEQAIRIQAADADVCQLSKAAAANHAVVCRSHRTVPPTLRLFGSH
jgi:hypothetical protein